MKKNYIYAVCTVLIWSTSTTVVKSLLSNIPNFEALFISGLFAFVSLFAMSIFKGKAKDLAKFRRCDIAAMAGLGFIGVFLYSALLYYGLTILSAQEACILNYLWPVMLVFFSSLILKEKLTAAKCAAIACSFTGIIILSFGGSLSAAEGRPVGIAVCIASAACYGLFSVLNKKADYDQDIAMMIVWLVEAVCSLLAGLLTEQWTAVHGAQWLGLIWLGVVIDAAAYLMWALALKGADNTAAIANLAYLTPFLSIVVSAIFLKESIKTNALIALAFIIGGILLQQLLDKKESE